MASVQRPILLNKDNIRTFVQSFDAVVTDCDGVIWTGDDRIGQANLSLNKLREMGKKVFYVTNNSTKSRDECVKKCHRLEYIANKVSHTIEKS